MSKIKECPFCGGAAHIAKYKGQKDTYYATCDSCFAESDLKESEQEAMEAWNRRFSHDK
ncbi:restriction alleviation protein, Lar family [Anaerovibrio lipolyticus DSM 3074]|uniref:Restriction alleviation protein, Lar family n=1 Tax=Anaerovibrio lipolyticus DSM 3074 TaxID=1120997 RepID=A0A1M6FWQ9_9FIRM|nr:Lar family restriction alleviation protein [Anaerovibrio lipolyticus]SHJ02117.1 restriction alleviation protein, Lar family [Anaerovibrio lipolyticus DSM 3074]